MSLNIRKFYEFKYRVGGFICQLKFQFRLVLGFVLKIHHAFGARRFSPTNINRILISNHSQLTYIQLDQGQASNNSSKMKMATVAHDIWLISDKFTKKKMENPTFCTKICPIDYKDQTQDKLDNRDKKETIKQKHKNYEIQPRGFMIYIHKNYL